MEARFSFRALASETGCPSVVIEDVVPWAGARRRFEEGSGRMVEARRIWKASLIGVTAAAVIATSCSSDSRRAEREEAGASGLGAAAGWNAAGEGPSSGASQGQAGAGDQGGGTHASGGASGAASTGGEGGASAQAGAAGTACTPFAAAGNDGGGGVAADGPSRVLYTNDFETPNVELVAACGNSLDARGINALYGAEGFVYQQVNTVEGVVIDDPGGLYSDPAGVAKKYALGMLSTLQDDLLALTFDVTGKSFLNVGFDLSPIDVNGCGGPFGIAVPVMQVRLYDTPTGEFSFGAPGTLLAQGDVSGVAAPNPWTFAWRYGVASLDATAATGSSVTVVFDLLQSGYAAFDNLSIVAADSAGVVDRNNDGVPDDQQCLP